MARELMQARSTDTRVARGRETVTSELIERDEEDVSLHSSCLVASHRRRRLQGTPTHRQASEVVAAWQAT